MADVHELYNEAEQLKAEGKNEEAVAKLEEALAIDDSHTLSHLALAVLYGKLDKHDQAIQHGRRAVELEPNDPFSYTALSVTYQRAWAGTQKQEYIQLAEEAKARGQMLHGQ